jgi:hypothetical protein
MKPTASSRPVIEGAGPDITPAQREADEWADGLIRNRLPALRTLGGQWAATIAALTGLLGAGTVIDADDAVRGLKEPWGPVYGLLVGAALISAAVATYLAGEVAAGGLREIPIDINERLNLQDRLYRNAVQRFHWSRAATAAALVLLGLSFAVRWYAPVT